MNTHKIDGDPPIPVLLRRTSRARRISLRVAHMDGRVTLTVPESVSDNDALSFAEEKADWIRMHLARQASAVPMAAHDRVYRGLRGRIMHGELTPGQALTLRGLGSEYDVSMTPAREALRRLSAEGALTCRARAACPTPELANERIEELAALRALLEVELASRALPRAHMALIDRLQPSTGRSPRPSITMMRWATCAGTSNFTARFTCARRRPRCWPWPKPSGCNWGPRCARFTDG
jgi:hypothetical protein